MWPFDRFAYPGYVAAIVVGIFLVLISAPLSTTPLHPLIPFFVKYLGMLMAFWGVVWYGFNWLLDYGLVRY